MSSTLTSPDDDWAFAWPVTAEDWDEFNDGTRKGDVGIPLGPKSALDILVDAATTLMEEYGPDPELVEAILCLRGYYAR